MEYKKLSIKKFASKSYKHSFDARYWKKFQTVYAKLEQGFMVSDATFCRKQDMTQFNPNEKQGQILATA